MERSRTDMDDIVDRLRNPELLKLWGVEVHLLALGAADEIKRLRAVVDWFVEDRAGDFEDHPEWGPSLAYDGIVYDSMSGGNLPADIVELFRKARRG
jgi:hypothetical protein